MAPPKFAKLQLYVAKKKKKKRTEVLHNVCGREFASMFRTLTFGCVLKRRSHYSCIFRTAVCGHCVVRDVFLPRVISPATLGCRHVFSANMCSSMFTNMFSVSMCTHVCTCLQNCAQTCLKHTYMYKAKMLGTCSRRVRGYFCRGVRGENSLSLL